MSVIDVTAEFRTDDDCLAYLETMRWPDGIRCPVCGGERISRITRKSMSKNKRTRIYQCLERSCKQQFSATAGTIFNDSHLPLTKWFMALALIVDSQKSMSAKELQGSLDIGSYKTAWYMAHRIRRAMENDAQTNLMGAVEADGTYPQRVSIRHLRRSLSECVKRLNARKAGEGIEPTLRRMLGIEPMPCAAPAAVPAG